MLNNNISFKNFSLQSKKFNDNLKKVNKVFQSFKTDFNNCKIPSKNIFRRFIAYGRPRSMFQSNNLYVL